jgi:hypothetical protein
MLHMHSNRNSIKLYTLQLQLFWVPLVLGGAEDLSSDDIVDEQL